MDKKNKIRVSACCEAEIEYGGGGYTDDSIAPIEEFCSKCEQVLAIDGFEQEALSRKTGRRYKNNFKYIKKPKE